jgi:hypothetical protein
MYSAMLIIEACSKTNVFGRWSPVAPLMLAANSTDEIESKSSSVEERPVNSRT